MPKGIPGFIIENFGVILSDPERSRRGSRRIRIFFAGERILRCAQDDRPSSVTAYAVPPSPKGKAWRAIRESSLRPTTIMFVGEGLDPPFYRWTQLQMGGSRPSPTDFVGSRDEKRACFTARPFGNITYRRVPYPGRGGPPRTGSPAAPRDPRCKRSRQRSYR